ncbi:MAG: DUF3795 domain-containing protein [Bilophila wadsworthia]
MGTPRDVGLAAGFLVSDASAYMTGQALNVTGGKSPSSSVSPSPKLSDGLSPEAAFPVFLGFSFRLPCLLHQQTESRPMKPHETAFPCETPRLSFRMAGPSCTEGMVTYWPHSAAVTEAGACGGPCQGMHEGINGGGRKAGSQSQEKGLFASPFFPRKPGTPSAPANAPPQPKDDSAKTMRIGLAGQHDSESYLEEALRFAVLTLIPAHALRGLRVIVPHAHERVSLLKQYGFEPSEEGGPALFQRADRTYFDAGKGMALCWMACCVCSENPTCAGCRNGDARAGRCQPFSCCKQKSSTAAGSARHSPATTPCSTSSACGRSPPLSSNTGKPR